MANWNPFSSAELSAFNVVIDKRRQAVRESGLWWKNLFSDADLYIESQLDFFEPLAKTLQLVGTIREVTFK